MAGSPPSPTAARTIPARRTLLRAATALGPLLALVGWTALGDVWRTTDGSLDAAVALVWAAGAALVIVALAARTMWQRSALFAALAILGQAAALQLIEAPPHAAFQHFVGWGALLDDAARVPALLLLAAQTGVVLVIGRQVLTDLGGALGRGRLVGPYAALTIAGVWLFAAAVPTRDVVAFAGEIVFVMWVGALSLLTLMLAARAAPRAGLTAVGRWLSRRTTLPNGEPQPALGWDSAVPWVTAGFVTAGAAVLAVLVFEGIPHIDDSVAYLFQAKYFAAGRLYLPAPPDPAAFEMPHILNDGVRWFSKYPPGWPVVLALGVLAGVPWLVNPILGGLTVVASHAVVGRLYDRGVANVTVLLLATSPWFLFMSASFMAHALGALLGLTAVYAVLRARMSRGGGWGLAAGAALGALFLTRPLEAVLVGGALAVWSLGFGERRLSLAGMAGVAVGGAAASAPGLLYNARLTGSPTTSPFTLWSDLTYGPGTDVLGFGRHVGIPAWTNLDPLPGHGALDVVLNLNKNLHLANTELFGWLFGSLSLLLVGMFVRGRTRQHPLLWILVAWVVVGHSFYWFSGGPDFGPRYWYQLLVPLVTLSVVAAMSIRDRVAAVVPFVVAAVACAAITFVPWRSVTKYHHYRDMSGEVAHLAAEAGIVDGLVLVRPAGPRDYAAAFVLNPPTLRHGATIYARDADSTNTAAVVTAFPDRPVWLIGRGETAGTPFTVLAGPLPPGTVPE